MLKRGRPKTDSTGAKKPGAVASLERVSIHKRTMRMALSSTQSRLIDVAIDHFVRWGMDGASTRKIARDARAPMSAITYHFGSKEGLYLAAADHIAARLHMQLAPT